MPRKSKIKYDPHLTIEENAANNNCTVDGIRYYIKTHNIDRRSEAKVNIVNDIRKYLKEHPEASQKEVAEETKHGINTIRNYWDVAKGEKKLTSKIGSKKVRKIDIRQYRNFYATHPTCVCDLLEVERFNEHILEPFCGSGSISKVLEGYGHKVLSYDIVDRGFGNVGDFFTVNFQKRTYDVVSNPPYNKSLNEIILRCIEISKKKVALLLPLRYLSGEARFKEIYKKLPPSRVYVYQDRICIAKDGEFEKYDAGSNEELYAWYVWEKGYEGETLIRWIKNCDYIDEKKLKYASILNGYDFYPSEWFEYTADECIIFHSQAAPENRVLSNHYDCIIKFRGVEFYGVEQLYHMMQYSHSPEIMREIMACNSGIDAKSLCKNHYPEKRDWDAPLKQYNVIAICHLFKYLTYKPYRDRLRETYPIPLIENPRGKDDHFGVVQDLNTNLYKGNNCSGRTTMLIRDSLYEEEQAVLQEHDLDNLSAEQIEELLVKEVYEPFIADYEKAPAVVEVSQKVIDFIEKEGIPKIRPRRPVFQAIPLKDEKAKCILMDFDNTLFNTTADDQLRKYCKGERNWDRIYECIPNYRLYEGWKEVYQWAKGNNVRLGIVSSASATLINKTLAHFNLSFDVVIGDRWGMPKPNPLLIRFALDELDVLDKNVIYAGDSLVDEKMARGAGVKFVGCIWDSTEADGLKEKGKTISNPTDIIGIINNW